MALMKCSECGNELNNEDIVCAKCGCLVEENGNNSNDSSKNRSWKLYIRNRKEK